MRSPRIFKVHSLAVCVVVLYRLLFLLYGSWYHEIHDSRSGQHEMLYYFEVHALALYVLVRLRLPFLIYGILHYDIYVREPRSISKGTLRCCPVPTPVPLIRELVPRR